MLQTLKGGFTILTIDLLTLDLEETVSKNHYCLIHTSTNWTNAKVNLTLQLIITNLYANFKDKKTMMLLYTYVEIFFI